MELDDDDMIVVIIGDESQKTSSDASAEITYNTKISAQENSKITVKEEVEDDFECEYLEDTKFLEKLENMKSETVDITIESDDIKYIVSHSIEPNEDDNEFRIKIDNPRTVVQRRSHLKPSDYKSFVAELKSRYPELRKNQNLLVDTLAEIMRNIKVPKVPEIICKQNESNTFTCIYCESVSSTMTTARRHYQERHGSYYLVCYACGLNFRCTLNLYRHEKRCRAPDAQVVLRARARSIGTKARGRPFIQHCPKPPRQKSKARLSLSCSLCPAMFSTKLALTAHENFHKGQRPYRCDACSNAYTSAHALHRHMNTHKNEKFICDHCGKSFNMKHILIGHMNTHLPTKKFQCKECDSRFAQKAAMIRHVNKVHKLLPPPCVCEVCEKRYMRMSVLKIHMRKAHGMTLISRNMFQKAFPKMSDVEVKTILNHD